MAQPFLQFSSKRVSTGTNEPTVVRFELSLRSLMVVLSIIAGMWILTRILPVLLVLVMALMLVGALTPAVAWLEQRKIGRTFALCIIFGISLAVAAALATITVPTVISQVKTLVDNEAGIRETIASYLEQSPLTASLAEDLRNIHYAELVKSFKATLLTVGTNMVAIVAYSVATIFLAFYIMIDRDRLRGALFAVVPRTHHIRLSRILLNLGTIVGGYLRGQILTCVITSAFLFVLLMVCRVPNALAIAVFGGIMDLLPYIGAFLTIGPAVLAASVKGPAIAGIVFVALLAYEELESRVLVPLVYGRSLRLPSSVIFFSLLVGTTLGGIVGALLALPIASTVLMLVGELRVELPGETIQPEDIEQRRQDHRTEAEYERRAESMPAEQAAAVAVAIADEQKKAAQEEAAKESGKTPDVDKTTPTLEQTPSPASQGTPVG